MRLIDADELVKYLQYVTVTEGITFETGFKQILNDIKNAPTIEVEPVKHGKWKCYYDTELCGEVVECSECEVIFFTLSEDTECFMTNYCPNCGARMDGE